MTAIPDTAADFAADLRAAARQAADLIATLEQSTHGISLRAGYREPFQWGTSSARDLVALLVKLANDETHTTDEQESAA